jgi:hypothetical protein
MLVTEESEEKQTKLLFYLGTEDAENVSLNCVETSKWRSEFLSKQDRHCTCDAILRRVRLTIVAVENNRYYILL